MVQRVVSLYVGEIAAILTDETRSAEQRIDATLQYLREEELYQEPPFDFDACFEGVRDRATEWHNRYGSTLLEGDDEVDS